MKLKEPKRATIGVRPLKVGEQPILEATDGHLTVYGPVNRPSSPPVAVYVPPVQSVPPTGEPSHAEEETHVESSDSVEIVEVRREKRKEASSGGYVGTSKRRRRLIGEDELDAPDEMSATSAQKNQDRSLPLV